MSAVNDVEQLVIQNLKIYSEFRRAILGEFFQFIREPQARSLTSRGALNARLTKILLSYSSRFANKLLDGRTSLVSVILANAFTQVEDNPLSNEEMDTMEDFFVSMFSRASFNIQNQMSSDVQNLSITFNRFLMRVQMATSSGKPRELALQEERGRLLNNVDLYRRDSLGRKRDSEQFVFTELRFAFYRSFNIAMVYLLSKIGETRARIDRPAHPSNLRVIDLDEFESLEGVLFHPNAKALLVPV